MRKDSKNSFLEVSEKLLILGQRPLITQITKRLHRFFRRSLNLCNLFFNLLIRDFYIFRLFQKSPLKLSFIIYFSLFLCGCEAMQRKFIRKPKIPKPSPIVAMHEYATPQISKEDLYRQHFAYWQSWQSEAINSLDENFNTPINYKRIIRAADGANEELGMIKMLLSDDMLGRLNHIIKEQQVVIAPLTSAHPSPMHIKNFRDVFEKNIRIINREFSFKRVEKKLKH